MSKSDSKISNAQSMLNLILNTIPKENYIKLHSCYDITIPLDWSFSNRKISDYHIAFIRNGNGSYFLEDEQIAMEKGRIIFISNNYTHSRILDKNNISKAVLIRFGIYDNLDDKLATEQFKPFAFSFIPQDVGIFNILLTRIAETYNVAETVPAQKLCGLLLSSVILEMYKEIFAAEPPKNPADKRLEKAALYVQNNYDKTITIDELASISGISKHYFREQFKKCYGMTPKKYIIHSKIKMASILLSESDKTIKQVAEILGYPDQYTFSKQFKSIKGYPPGYKTNRQLKL